MKTGWWPKDPITRYKAVVFDLFGTLIDLKTDHHTLDRLFERLQLAPEQRLPARIIAMTYQFSSVAELAERLKPGARIDCSDLGRMAQTDMLPHNIRVYPDATDVLCTLLKAKYRHVQLGIISNLTSMYMPVFKALPPFFESFDHIVVSCETGMYKPHPGIYRLMVGKMAEKMAIEPGQIIMIGDQRKKDCDMARAAGMHGIHLDRSGKSPDSVNSLSAILKYF